MKKIINGRLYNTETSIRMGSHETGTCGSIDYSEETLYRKRTGEFFIHGYGGANTKYARRNASGNWCSGEEITPLEYDAARKWAEHHLEADDYEKAFGEIAEDETSVAMHFTISASAAEKIRRGAAQKGVTIGTYIEAILAKK